MKYRNIRPLVLLGIINFAFTLSACHRSSNLIQYETKTFQKSEASCAPKKEDCTYLSFQYPQFTEAKTPQIVSTLNQEVQFFLLNPSGEYHAKDLADFFQNFFEEHQKAVKDFPKFPQSWYLERTAKVDLNNGWVLVLETMDSEYTGGAHPNTYLKYTNFDAGTGKILKLSNLFTPGYEDKLGSVAEKRFREKQQIPSSQNLEEAGYFFEKGKFKLPDNFSLTPSGLNFYFNPYEAAPYAQGPIEFEVPYSDLKDLILPDGVAARMLKQKK